MVTKLEMASIEESSTRSSNDYLKRFKLKPSRVTVEYFNGEQGSNASVQTPTDQESQSDDAPRDRCVDDPYRPQRPSMTPRRVLRKTPMAPEASSIAVNYPSPSNSERSTGAVKSFRGERFKKARKAVWSVPKSPKTKSSKPAESPKSKQRRMFGIKKNRIPSTPPSPTKVQRLISVSDDEARLTSDPTNDSRSTSQPGYHPPTSTDSGSRARSYSHGSSTKDTKNKANDQKREQSSPLEVSSSMGSNIMHKDRYSMDDGSVPSQHQRAPVHHNVYTSEAASSGMGKQDGNFAPSSGPLFTFDTRDTRDTRNFSGAETYDDTYVGETFTDDDNSKTYMMSFRYGSSLSDNTSSFDGSVVIKQQVAWGCIGLSAAQFAVLTTQVLLCGIAALSINPLIGPYPDAFSEWGGKNTYLLMVDQQYFRFITPIFLHVGYLHLLVNVFFQLETCAYLEREWGFFQWFTIYLISGFGSCLAASTIDPNVIGVCSSGALMGLFGSRIAQAILWTSFETGEEFVGQGAVIFERLGGTVCSAAVVFFLTFLTYIDWSGHLGGLFTGFLTGLVVFSHAVKDVRQRAMLRFIGLVGMAMGGAILGTILFYYAEADEELADACSYFRNLYKEGYSCECQAFD